MENKPSRKRIWVSAGEYYDSFLKEWKESGKTKKDFIVEMANEFISDEFPEMKKIKLPAPKKAGRKIVYKTEEERLEARKKVNREAMKRRHEDPVLREKDNKRNRDWEKKNYCHITLSVSTSHFEEIEKIIKPTGMKVSDFFKKAIMEFLDENYDCLDQEDQNSKTK